MYINRYKNYKCNSGTTDEEIEYADSPGTCLVESVHVMPDIGECEEDDQSLITDTQGML